MTFLMASCKIRSDWAKLKQLLIYLSILFIVFSFSFGYVFCPVLIWFFFFFCQGLIRQIRLCPPVWMVSCCCPLTEWHSSVKLNSFQLKTVTCSSPVPVRRCVASSSSIFLHLSPRSHPSTPLRLLWAGDRRQTHSALMDKTLPPPTHPQLGSIVLTGEWTAQHEHPKALVWMRLNVSGVSELRRVIRWTSGPTGRCMFLQVWTVIEWLWKERCHFSWNHVYENI